MFEINPCCNIHFHGTIVFQWINIPHFLSSFYSLWTCVVLVLKYFTLTHTISMNILMSCVQMYKCKKFSNVCVWHTGNDGVWGWKSSFIFLIRISNCINHPFPTPISTTSIIYQMSFMNEKKRFNVVLTNQNKWWIKSQTLINTVNVYQLFKISS